MRRWIAAGFCLLSVAVRAQAPSPLTGPSTGTLVVTAEPANAAVLVDGDLRGRVPVTLTVPSGAHVLRITLGGYTPFEETVTVPPGDTLRVETVLERRLGIISVRELPEGAAATVNGQPLATTQPMPTGLVNVVVTRPGYPDLRSVVAVPPDAETTVTYDETAFRPWRALLAATNPGTLQIRDGRVGMGALYATAVYGGLATVVGTTIAANNANGDIPQALFEYEDADNEPDAVAAREEMERLTSVVRTSRRVRGGAAVFAGVAYLVSLVDSFSRHVRQPSLVTTSARLPSVSAIVSGDRIGVAFSL